MSIHPTAVIGENARIDPTAQIGAWAVLEPGVTIGPQTRIFPHAYIAAGTTIGARCSIHPFAVVGHWPQDLAWKADPSFTTIGDETVIREHVSVHRGTMPGSTTVIGARCYLMATSHVAHNCVIGDEVKLTNGCSLAGHVRVGARAFLTANALVHQFTRIGELAMVAGGLRITQDIPPYMLFGPLGVMGPNVVGLRRAGFTPAERQELRHCHRLVYRSDLHFPAAIERVAEFVETDAGRKFLEFLRGPSRRGFAMLRRSRRAVETPQEATE